MAAAIDLSLMTCAAGPDADASNLQRALDGIAAGFSGPQFRKVEHIFVEGAHICVSYEGSHVSLKILEMGMLNDFRLVKDNVVVFDSLRQIFEQQEKDRKLLEKKVGTLRSYLNPFLENKQKRKHK